MTPDATKRYWKIVLVAALVVTAALGGYLTGQYQERQDTEVADLDFGNSTGPSGTVAFACDTNVCSATVTVSEWGAYQSLIVYNTSGVTADRRFLHPGDEQLTVRNIPRDSDKYDDVVLAAPVGRNTLTMPKWSQAFDASDGTQAFEVVIEHEYTVPIYPEDTR